MKNYMTILFCGLCTVVLPQDKHWVQVQEIEVIKDGRPLMMAWAGGMNYPQFSSMDLDDDGQEDMVVFERDGDVIRTFVYKEGKYHYSPRYERFFPPLRNWALLVDNDSDGLKDIFAFNVLGIELWSRVGGRDTLLWEKETFDYNTPDGIVTRDAIKTVGQGGYDININVNYQDIPAISDIDGDGSPDILCFGLTTALPQGVTLEYFRQVTPLVFAREDYCWGGFAQSYTSNDIYLDVCGVGDSMKKKPPTRMMHLGSALLAMDVSGNGLKDIIMGELSFPNATVVYNTGSSVYARMTRCDAHFPVEDNPVHIENLPAFYAVDTDHDGSEELIVAPAVTGSENHNNVWLYKNVSSTPVKRFKQMSNSFLVEDMIDVGECSRATFADVTRDGREDMILSTYGYYNKGGGYTSRLSLYKNTSIGNKTSFTLIDDDYAGFSSWKREALHPSLGDVNSDGILDMIIGDGEGYVHMLIGSKDGTYIVDRYYLCGVDVGDNAMPALWDVDEDGLLDIVVGGSTGRLYLLCNRGTRTAPHYEIVSQVWAGVDYSMYAGQGNTLSPAFYRKQGRDYMLLGLRGGSVALYELYDGDMRLIDEDVIGYSVGKNATATRYVSMAGDSYMVVGCAAGGFLLFKDNDREDSPYDNEKTITLYPNPTSDLLYVEIEDKLCKRWTIYDSSGGKCLTGYTLPIDVKSLPRGIYILRIEGINGESYTSRFIVK
ncbi:MAG: T9SS type A sorting domain-containing protein [Flavobacteriales bacterium]|nr:T9SS type A sorting domain-containing protein [Flavobacteriales bacterium]